MPTDRPALSFDRARQTMTVGRRTVAMASGPDDNESILRAYLRLVSEQRGVPLGQSVLLRRRDIAVLADFLDLDDEALEAKLAAALRLSRGEASHLRSQLLRHRVVAAAVGVGVLAGAGLVTDRAAAEPGATDRSAAVQQAAPSTGGGPLGTDALARMDAIVESTPVVAVPRNQWHRRSRRPAVAVAPGHAGLGVEIGDALVLER